MSIHPVTSPLEAAHIQSNAENTNYLDIENHEVNIHAVASNPLGITEVGQALSSDQKFIILRRLGFEGLESLDDLPFTASFLIEKTEGLSVKESIDIIKKAIEEHKDDSNITTVDYDFYERLIQDTPDSYNTPLDYDYGQSSSSLPEKKENAEVKVEELSDSVSPEDLRHSPYDIVDWPLQIRLEAAIIAYHSPYQEVRAVTDPYDDPTIPVETIRVYVLGVIWTCISAFVNAFFNDRLPSITFLGGVVQMFLYPCGKLWEYAVPNFKFKILGVSFELNPGPWTYKEQILAGLMFTLGGQASYVLSNITAQKLSIYYNNQWVDIGYQILLLLSTNFLGIGFAGILRKFVIYPANAVWPSVLPTLAMNKALTEPEKKEKINGWTISRYRFFFYVTLGSFLYFWLPDYLFQALSVFNWLTWIEPQNFNLAVITGSSAGLGFNPVPSFDWNIIGTNALVLPFYTTVNSYVGSLIGFIAIIGVYYSNYKWTAYLPVNTNTLFSNTGEPYDITQVLNSKSQFVQEKYEQYGPPFYTAANLVQYGAFFALYPFAIIYEVTMTYKPLWKSIKHFFTSLRYLHRSTFDGFTDPHSVMMRKYKEVPDYMFLAIVVIGTVLAILCVKLYPAETPVWAIFFSIGINFVFLIPLTTLYATTGFSFGLNVLVELIIGYAIPGNGLALNFIKALGYNIDGQAQLYIADQKMGHYAKLPPRAMFRVQLLGCFVGTFINLAALDFKLNNLKDYCLPHQKDKFTCPDTSTLFTSSVIWGVIGPKKVFGGLYPILQWTFLMGFVAAILCILFKWYAPKKYTKYFQPSVLIGGMIIWAPGNLYYQTGPLYLSIAFMWYLKNKYTAFWSKYNYVFSSAMTAGVAFSSIIIFFSVQYHPKNINWWGNTVPFEGIDGGLGQQSLLNATVDAPDSYFGPRVGHYP